MEPKTPEEIAKKLWHIARVIFFMLRRGISKSRIAVDLGLVVKRGNKLAGKAIRNFLTFSGVNHHGHGHTSSSSHLKPVSLIGCRSNDAVSFVSPREYEFSCSNSPAAISFFPFNKRGGGKHGKAAAKYDEVADVQRMLEMLTYNDVHAAAMMASAAASPMVPLPGLGKSPSARQLRITDSPFPVRDEAAGEGDDGGQVDKAADEFIKRFYKDLKSEKATSLESPSPYHRAYGPDDEIRR